MSDDRVPSVRQGQWTWRRLEATARLIFLALALLMGAVCGPAGVLHAEAYSEADVRAVFLLNFALFIDWPEAAFESSSSPYRFCVLGSRVLSESLQRALADEHVGSRRLELGVAEAPKAWRRCHVLYVDGSTSGGWDRVLGAVRGAPVLTVGDSPAFVRSGGMIGLVRKGGRLRPIIDRKAAERAGIRISSKLLRLATIVSAEGE